MDWMGATRAAAAVLAACALATAAPAAPAAAVNIAAPTVARAVEPPPGGDACGQGQPVPCATADKIPCYLYVAPTKFVAEAGTHGYNVQTAELTCSGETFVKARVRVMDTQRFRRVEKRYMRIPRIGGPDLLCDRCAPDCDRCVPDLWITVNKGRWSDWTKRRFILAKTTTSCDARSPSRHHRGYVYVQVETTDDGVLEGRFAALPEDVRKGPCHVDWDRADT